MKRPQIVERIRKNWSVAGNWMYAYLNSIKTLNYKTKKKG